MRALMKYQNDKSTNNRGRDKKRHRKGEWEGTERKKTLKQRGNGKIKMAEPNFTDNMKEGVKVGNSWYDNTYALSLKTNLNRIR